jgi:hypothetical protein
MAKKRINGEGTVWFVASEKRYRAQYPAGGKRRTISGKTRREVELKLRDALAKRDTNTLEKSRKDSAKKALARTIRKEICPIKPRNRKNSSFG